MVSDAINASPAGRPLVSVRVVNYKGGERLMCSLESLLADSYLVREVFVVDNASTDGSQDALDETLAHHPEVTLLRSERNLGYAGGVN